jgi:hypothetical protein
MCPRNRPLVTDELVAEDVLGLRQRSADRTERSSSSRRRSVIGSDAWLRCVLAKGRLTGRSARDQRGRTVPRVRPCQRRWLVARRGVATHDCTLDADIIGRRKGGLTMSPDKRKPNPPAAASGAPTSPRHHRPVTGPPNAKSPSPRRSATAPGHMAPDQELARERIKRDECGQWDGPCWMPRDVPVVNAATRSTQCTRSANRPTVDRANVSSVGRSGRPIERKGTSPMALAAMRDLLVRC